jgi:hypothetical protein
MNIEDVFRAIFWTLLVSVFLIRFWFGIATLNQRNRNVRATSRGATRNPVAARL